MDHNRNIEILKEIKGLIECSMSYENEIDNDQKITPDIIYYLSQLHGILSRFKEIQ